MIFVSFFNALFGNSSNFRDLYAKATEYEDEEDSRSTTPQWTRSRLSNLLLKDVHRHRDEEEGEKKSDLETTPTIPASADKVIGER